MGFSGIHGISGTSFFATIPTTVPKEGSSKMRPKRSAGCDL